MWKHIIFQGLFQLIVLLFLYLAAPSFVKETDPVRLAENAIIYRCFGEMPGGGDADKIEYIINGSSAKWGSGTRLKTSSEYICGTYSEKQDLSVAYKYYNSANSGTVHMTMIFNVFVFYTLFNQINSRILDDSFNIFRRIHTNLYFPIIFVLEAILQVIIVIFGKSAFHTAETGLTGGQWGICIGFSAISFVISIIAKLIPLDVPIQKWLDRHDEEKEMKEEKEDNDDKISVCTNHQLIQMKPVGDSSTEKKDVTNPLVNEINVQKKNSNNEKID